MLKRLHLENVGPASVMDVEFADRLNVFTGDNGLGKTFVLDAAWYFLGDPNQQFAPKPNQSRSGQPEFEYEFAQSLNQSLNGRKHGFQFELRKQGWLSTSPRGSAPLIGTIAPLVALSDLPESVLGIYVKTDNKFSIIDSLRTTSKLGREFLDPLEFSASQLWNGLKLDEIVLCNGLISDWLRWQNHPDRTTFNLFWQIIAQLFPVTEQPIESQPTRLSLKNVQDIPTLQLSYGQVPITQLSAGMKRIITLAYSLVWTWYEHKQAAALAEVSPSKKLLLLIDEMELHLHPQWQRSIFPAILKAIELLNPDIKVQLLTTTHSPLVLASLEPYFDEETDKLFGFDLVDREVVLEEMPWVKLGEVDDWLTSPIFGLSRPRSKEAEVAIDAAFAIMRNADMSNFPANLRTQDDIHKNLLKVLPDDDSFWRRWIVTAEGMKVS
jgi:AAA domain, putative AbiEii toxin, Type IV TA system